MTNDTLFYNAAAAAASAAGFLCEWLLVHEIISAQTQSCKNVAKRWTTSLNELPIMAPQRIRNRSLATLGSASPPVNLSSQSSSSTFQFNPAARSFIPAVQSSAYNSSIRSSGDLSVSGALSGETLLSGLHVFVGSHGDCPGCVGSLHDIYNKVIATMPLRDGQRMGRGDAIQVYDKRPEDLNMMHIDHIVMLNHLTVLVCDFDLPKMLDDISNMGGSYIDDFTLALHATDDADQWRRQSPGEFYASWFGGGLRGGLPVQDGRYMLPGRVMHLHSVLHSKRVVSRWQLFDQMEQLGRMASIRMLLDMHDNSKIKLIDPVRLRRALKNPQPDYGLSGRRPC